MLTALQLVVLHLSANVATVTSMPLRQGPSCASPSNPKSRRRPAVCDDFTSVVDRTVAKIGSHAVAKAVRARGLKFVAVSCHEDIIDWLQPDWVYRPDANSFAWRSLQRRPTLDIELVRTTASAW